MFDSEAIKTLAEAESISSANESLDMAIGKDSLHATLALPSDYTIHDLEKTLANRRRARGTMTTSVLEHFAQYTEAHKEPGASVFVSADDMKAVAVLNLGSPDKPGHADNRAELVAQKTAPFVAMLGVVGRSLKQQEAAEFLEDWGAYIRCVDEDGGDIEIRRAVGAMRRLTIESARKVESEVGRLSATASALDSVRASSVETIPAFVHFTCDPYIGMGERSFAMRVGILTTDKPAVVLRVIAMEKHREDMADELADLVGKAFKDSLPVHIGVYRAST